MANTKDPVSLRFDQAFHQRLQKAADALGIPKHTLCQLAIKAAIDAVEQAGSLTFPIQFSVASGRASAKKKKRP